MMIYVNSVTLENKALSDLEILNAVKKFDSIF